MQASSYPSHSYPFETEVIVACTLTCDNIYVIFLSLIFELSAKSSKRQAMYSTKSRTVDRLIDIKGEREKRWITIGNPYKDVREAIPSRWKKKQFDCIRHPKNAGGGYFGYNGKAFTYAPQKFQEVPLYVTSHPLQGRKQGFGMRDVMKRDEFCNAIACERYRDTLRAEQRIMNEQRNSEAEVRVVFLRNTEQESWLFLTRVETLAI